MLKMLLIKITFILSVTFCVTTGQLESASSQKLTANSSESLSSPSLAQTVRGDSLFQPQTGTQTTEANVAVSKGKQVSQDDQNFDSPKVAVVALDDKVVHENQNKSSHDIHRIDQRRRQPDRTVSLRRKESQRIRSSASGREISDIRIPSRRTELQQRVSWPQEQKITAQITVQHPRVLQRKIELRRVTQRKSEAQPMTERQERPKLEGTTVRNESRKANPFSQLDSHRFQQPDQQGQQQRQKDFLHPQSRFTSSNRTPVFDIARTSSSKNLGPQVGNFKTRLPGRDKYFPTAQPTDPVPSVIPVASDGDASRSNKPISFNLGFRRRIRYHRPTQNKTLRSQIIPQQGEARTRPLVRYVRPNSSSRQHNLSESNNSDLPLNSKNGSDSDWIPKHGPQQISTKENVTLTAPTSIATPLSSIHSVEKTIGNITLSLQHARQLFARAQERYKAISGENSSDSGNATANLNSAPVEPEGQYSSSYSKIRQTDGSITQSSILSSSTTPRSTTAPPTTESSLATASNIYNISVPTNYSTELYSTSTSKPLEETSTSNTTISLTTSLSNNVTSPSNNIVSLSDNVTSPSGNTTSESYNVTSLSNNITTEPSFEEPNTENSSTLFTTTLPPPVYKNAHLGLSQFSAFQNFTPFGFGRSSQQQNIADLFQPPVSPSASGSSGQSLGLSNLFGLGNLPSLGSGLGSLGGFGLGQRFSSLTADANPAAQSGSTGLDLGYLGLLSGLSGLGLGQLGGTSSSPELSLPSIPQDSSGQQANTGLSFLSGLPSLSLSGLGGLSSLGSLGSIPSLGSLGSNSGNPGSGLSSLTGTGLSGLGLAGSGGVSGLGGIPGFGIPGSTLSGLSGSGSGTSNLGTITGKLSPTDKLTPVIGQSSGATFDLTQKITSVEDTLAAAVAPPVLPSGDISAPSLDTASSDPLTK